MAGQRQADAGVGHVHLQVGDVQSAQDFYVGTLGFEKTAGWHGQALFVSAGGYHHHMAMNVWNSRGAGPRRDTLGLGEVLIEVPSGDDVGGPRRPPQDCRRPVPPHRRRTALRGSVAQPDPRRRPLEVLARLSWLAGRVQRAQRPLDMSTLAGRDCWAIARARDSGTCPVLAAGNGHSWPYVHSLAGQDEGMSQSGRRSVSPGPAKDMSTLRRQDRGACPLVAAGNGHSWPYVHWSRSGEGMSTGRVGFPGQRGTCPLFAGRTAEHVQCSQSSEWT